jgi:hypothetical protein
MGSGAACLSDAADSSGRENCSSHWNASFRFCMISVNAPLVNVPGLRARVSTRMQPWKAVEGRGSAIRLFWDMHGHHTTWHDGTWHYTTSESS